MCLAVPMKVIEIKGDMAVVESAGLRRDVGIMLLDKVKLDDWVLIHAGFAISKLTQKQARETLAIFEEGQVLWLKKPSCPASPTACVLSRPGPAPRSWRSAARHTVAIRRFGIQRLLPETVKLVSGPGCPVCVTPDSFIDEAVALARQGVVVTSFGDMLRVPGSRSSLEKERAAGCRHPRRLFAARRPADRG